MQVDLDGFRGCLLGLAVGEAVGTADTTAAICGQIAGAYYGESNIPLKWLERLYMRTEITGLADNLSRAEHA